MQTEINQLDNEDRKHGPWLDYHDNGQLSYRGEYVHGQVHGIWLIKYYNGQTSYKVTYNMGKVINYYAIYNYDGLIKMRRFYAN